jgi:hypothetical protein
MMLESGWPLRSFPIFFQVERTWPPHSPNPLRQPGSVKRAGDSATGQSGEVLQIVRELQDAEAHRYVVVRTSHYETLLRAAPASMIVRGGWRRRGYLLAFAEIVVFCHKGGSRSGSDTVKVAYKDIVRASTSGNRLIMHTAASDKLGDLSAIRSPSGPSSPVPDGGPPPPSTSSPLMSPFERGRSSHPRSGQFLRTTPVAGFMRTGSFGAAAASAQGKGRFAGQRSAVVTVELETGQAADDMQVMHGKRLTSYCPKTPLVT